MREPVDTVVLGAGMSGLGAALSSGAPVFEAESRPGGVCHSFYLDENGGLCDAARDDVFDCYRFEPAGGHWLFGGDSALRRFGRFAQFRRYARRAAAFFPGQGWLVPFPLQEHLHRFDPALRRRVLAELLDEPTSAQDAPATFRDWLLRSFGPTLCELFFFPFNERYTAGLYGEVAPQDAYKSPVDRARILAGARAGGSNTGYNAVFHYPVGGLDRMVRAIAAHARIHTDHRVVRIDCERRVLCFEGGLEVGFRHLLSSIPLHTMADLCGLKTASRPDPASAVLVVNAAAHVGRACPPYHWIYVARARSGLHRVGFYSHVDRSFLPERRREVVSFYIERSYPVDRLPDAAEVDMTARAMLDELEEWGFIARPIVMHASVTSPAYTWSWPGSTWAAETELALRARGIRQIGRYGTWRFQGMADSFEQGWSCRSADVHTVEGRER